MNPRLTYLVDQYLSGRLSAPEQQELAALLRADAGRDDFSSIVVKKLEAGTPASPVMTDTWQTMAERIVQIDKAEMAKPSHRPAVKIARIWRWAAAAAVVIALAGVGYLMPDRTRHGGGGAALASGQATISTLRGQRLDAVALPDGSRVWLNAESSIRYDSSLNDRLITLSGEAYFDVVAIRDSPFRVRSGGVTTTVLGTSFNVTAYSGRSPLVVSVRTGKVSVQAAGSSSIVMQSGSQARILPDGHVLQMNVDTASIAGWTTGRLSYRNEKTVDILQDLERVFDCRIEMANEALKEESITVSVDKRAGVTAALELICRITDAKFVYSHGIYTLK